METVYWILAIIGAIPVAFTGLWWIAKRTKTKKDDKILEGIDKNAS